MRELSFKKLMDDLHYVISDPYIKRGQAILHMSGKRHGLKQHNYWANKYEPSKKDLNSLRIFEDLINIYKRNRRGR